MTRSMVLTALVIVVCLHIVEQFATDCYLPSFPAIAKSLRVANIGVQLSITFFLYTAFLTLVAII